MILVRPDIPSIMPQPPKEAGDQYQQPNLTLSNSEFNESSIDLPYAHANVGQNADDFSDINDPDHSASDYRDIVASE